MSSDRRLRDGGFGFFGAVTASLSHEINNVLATINELSGLLQDVLAAAEQGRPLKPERLKRSAERIGAQVKRGEGLVAQLNRFAHSVDHPLEALECEDSVAEVVALCERFARLRKVRLESTCPEGRVAIESNPFEVRHVVFRCLEIALEAAPEDTPIRVSFGATGPGAAIEVLAQGAVKNDELTRERLSFLELLVDRLGGAFESELEPSLCLRVSLPQEAPENLRSEAMGGEP